MEINDDSLRYEKSQRRMKMIMKGLMKNVALQYLILIFAALVVGKRNKIFGYATLVGGACLFREMGQRFNKTVVKDTENEELEDLDVSEFGLAQAFAKKQLGGIGTDMQLALYGLFKQATEGNCTKAKPSVLDMAGRAKWDSWSALKGVSKEDAEEKYIGLVSKLAPEWREGNTNSLPKAKSSSMAPVVSTLVEDMSINEEDLTPSDKLLMIAGEGDLEKLKDALKDTDVNTVMGPDDESLLHMACDRGHTDIVEYLIQIGAIVDSKDVDGLTPLAYAFCNDQDDLAKLLVNKYGANPHLNDNVGIPILDLCKNKELLKVMKAI